MCTATCARGNSYTSGNTFGIQIDSHIMQKEEGGLHDPHLIVVADQRVRMTNQALRTELLASIGLRMSRLVNSSCAFLQPAGLQLALAGVAFLERGRSGVIYVDGRQSPLTTSSNNTQILHMHTLPVGYTQRSTPGTCVGRRLPPRPTTPRSCT